MQGKSMVLAARRVRKSGWKAVEKRWPGGRRDGRILRFAEADTASASAFRLLCFHTAAACAGRIEPAERYTASPHIGISAADLGRIVV